MESQPQNPEFRINPENFHICDWCTCKCIHGIFTCFLLSADFSKINISKKSFRSTIKVSNQRIQIKTEVVLGCVGADLGSN